MRESQVTELEDQRWNEFRSLWLREVFASHAGLRSDLNGPATRFCEAATDPINEAEAYNLRNQIDVVYAFGIVRSDDETGYMNRIFAVFVSLRRRCHRQTGRHTSVRAFPGKWDTQTVHALEMGAAACACALPARARSRPRAPRPADRRPKAGGGCIYSIPLCSHPLICLRGIAIDGGKNPDTLVTSRFTGPCQPPRPRTGRVSRTILPQASVHRLARIHGYNGIDYSFVEKVGVNSLMKPARNRGSNSSDGAKKFTGVCDWLPSVWHRSALR